MKLYDRDYTVLTQAEQEKLRSSREEEVVGKSGSFNIRRPQFLSYPKAIRHHIQLFPNNYLDVVELQDEERLRSQLDEFRKLIDSDGVSERAIAQFIKQNGAYFIVGSILNRYFPFGHHGAYLFPEFQLGNSYQVDYVLVGKSSDGWEFVFTELEAPVGAVTLKNGDLGLAFRKGLAQTQNWDAWLQANYASLKETFDKCRRPDERLPDEFFTFDQSRCHYVVVAGKRSDFKEQTRRRRRTMKNDNRTLILHYDNLIDAAKDVIGDYAY